MVLQEKNPIGSISLFNFVGRGEVNFLFFGVLTVQQMYLTNTIRFKFATLNLRNVLKALYIGSASSHIQPLYLSQLPREHYIRVAIEMSHHPSILTKSFAAYSRILVLQIIAKLPTS